MFHWLWRNTHVLYRPPQTEDPSVQKEYSFCCKGPVTWNNLPFSIRHTQTYSSFKSHLRTHFSPKPSSRTPFLCIWLLWCSLHLICSHEMCPWSMYCSIACLDCINCSGMCACLPALCCWCWIVWCMHVLNVMFIVVLNCEVLRASLVGLCIICVTYYY